jgi:hypothetical protein
MDYGAVLFTSFLKQETFMSRLRRKRCVAFLSTVAAEVLETRALLSAGAAAAHAAVQHAQGQVISPAAKTVFDIDVTTSVSGSAHFSGFMTVSKISLTPGAHITAHVTVNVAPGHTIKGTISGLVQSSLPGAQDTTVTLTPGGKLVERSPTLHPPNVFLPSTTPTSLKFFTGTQIVTDINATFHVGATTVSVAIHTI